MKKWGFAGGPASHGSSLFHRGIGSTGQSATPGRVWKGKKMPGKMGNKNIITRNLWIHSIDPVNNVIFVKGCVPGAYGSWVRVRDSQWMDFPYPPPYPTYVPKEQELTEEILAVTPEPPGVKEYKK